MCVCELHWLVDLIFIFVCQFVFFWYYIIHYILITGKRLEIMG